MVGKEDPKIKILSKAHLGWTSRDHLPQRFLICFFSEGFLNCSEAAKKDQLST